MRAPLVLVCALALLAGSCQSAAAPSTSGRGGTLVFAKGKDANRLDPADVDDGESTTVTENIFEGLLRFKPESTEVEPCLATSWTLSPDGLTYTFHLRKGVRFQDGTPFDAQAVKFSFDRQRHPLSGQNMEFWKDFFEGTVGPIEVVDPDTVRIHLLKPDATFLTKLAIFSMAIVSPAAVRRWGVDFARHPVGTGPFRFVEWVPDEKIVLAPNPYYWGPRPHLDRVIFDPVPDNSVRLLELQVGSIDGEAGVSAMDGLDPDDLPRVRRDPQLRLMTQPGLNVGYLALNTTRPPLDDVRVRRAIALAIDKLALVRAFFADGQLGQVAVNPIPPILWSYDKAIRDYPFDPARARDLLAAAGYPHGFTLSLWAMPVPRPYMPDGLKVAQAIQNDLGRVGIRARIVTYDWATYLDKLGKGQAQAALIGWIGDFGDPDDFLYTFFDSANARIGSASNYSFYKNPQVDALLGHARSDPDHARRVADYIKIQEIVHRDEPIVPLFYAKQVVVLRRGVEGFHLQPTGSKLFDTVRLEGNP